MILFCILMTWTRCVQTPPTYTISRYAISNLLDLNKKVKEWITLLKRAPNFSLREQKCYETKVAKECCWATTQTAAEQVPVCGILLSADSLLYTQVYSWPHAGLCSVSTVKIRLAPVPPECNYSIWGVSMFSFLDFFF